MKEYGLTDEQVEAEIERLNASEAVALARREARLRYKRRQYLYQLIIFNIVPRHFRSGWRALAL